MHWRQNGFNFIPNMENTILSILRSTLYYFLRFTPYYLPQMFVKWGLGVSICFNSQWTCDKGLVDCIFGLNKNVLLCIWQTVYILLQHDYIFSSVLTIKTGSFVCWFICLSDCLSTFICQVTGSIGLKLPQFISGTLQFCSKNPVWLKTSDFLGHILLVA